MSLSLRTSVALRAVKEKVRPQGDESKHEQTDSWSNRDLIPLPPTRRTWGAFHFFGYWAISSLNISNWQTPNTYLRPLRQAGHGDHRYCSGPHRFVFDSHRVVWSPLAYRFYLAEPLHMGCEGQLYPTLAAHSPQFHLDAVQCWNGGRLIAVCLTAIWPSFNTIENTFGPDMPTTTSQFVGFVVFWFLSLPFLLIRPENFKRPFQIISIYCGLGMISIMIWSLAVARGVGPVFNTPESLPQGSQWNTSWLIMAGINEIIGSIAAGITNGSDFSRYSRSPQDYLVGTISSVWIIGVFVSFVGLVTTGACQKIYGEVYWNPPDLLMAMMDNGQGSSKARCGVFFLAAGFALTAMFENICGNAVAGGIDLAGLFPSYIDIRRGAMITFVAAWIVQPWQLINRAATFISVLSSFSVFLAPIMGVMFADFYLLRRGQIRLCHLYQLHDTQYYYWHGFNLRVIPAWIAGWAPTVGGLVVTVRGDMTASRGLYQLYYMAFLFGFFVSGTVFYVITKMFPLEGFGEYDEMDMYGTFTPTEAARLGVSPPEDTEVSESPSVSDKKGSTEDTVLPVL